MQKLLGGGGGGRGPVFLLRAINTWSILFIAPPLRLHFSTEELSVGKLVILALPMS
jgi:hypothetical protein